MNNNHKTARTISLLVIVLLVADQAIKLWVKTHMQMGEEIPLIGTWCRLHFIENQGFAFGMSLGGTFGKVLLSLFRILASIAIAWFIGRLLKRGSRRSLIYSLTLIFAGAVGNLIDCCFYGLIFNESYYSVATLFPPEGGYAPLLQGKVVDMFYFPLFQLDWPNWMPLIGGQHFEFFNAIFNLADAAITIGIFWLIIDQFFIAPKVTKSDKNSTEETEA